MKHEAAANRLKKIEGQVRGVQKMLEEDRYCIDILSQTKAIHSALRAVEEIILDGHLRSCVTNAFQSDNAELQDKQIKEVLEVFRKK